MIFEWFRTLTFELVHQNLRITNSGQSDRGRRVDQPFMKGYDRH